uniref:Copia protein n=1 Tax=Cajanus cajan TaxID=3821 RepID=A0A151UE46_CAJCA
MWHTRLRHPNSHVLKLVLTQCNLLPSNLLCDNQSAVAIVHNPIFHNKTKHMEIDVFFVRDKVLSMKLLVYHIPALDQWVDLLTKPLYATQFEVLRGKHKVQSFCDKPPP